MQENILRNSDITKIFLLYEENGSKKKFAIKLRFMDKRTCYFSTQSPINFTKPKRNINAELKVYTPEGIYTTQTKISDSYVSLHEVLFEVAVPKTWKFTQLRLSSRKSIQLPLTIKFNDGFTIETTTNDLSLNGCSFYHRDDISSIYKKITAILTLELPKETLINFPDGKMTVETKFVRLAEGDEGHFGEKLYAFSFLNLPNEGKDILKNFLIKLD